MSQAAPCASSIGRSTPAVSRPDPHLACTASALDNPPHNGHYALVSRRAKWWVASACVVVGLIVVAFLVDESGLDTLRSDPMATYELPSAISTRSSEHDGSSGFFAIEDTPAMLGKSFTVPPDEGEAAMAAIATAAQQAGWDVSANEFGGYSGDKTIGSTYAQISIRGIVSDDIVWFELYTRED